MCDESTFQIKGYLNYVANMTRPDVLNKLNQCQNNTYEWWNI